MMTLRQASSSAAAAGPPSRAGGSGPRRLDVTESPPAQGLGLDRDFEPRPRRRTFTVKFSPPASGAAGAGGPGAARRPK